MQIESTYRKLKFEDQFKIGESIKAQDFEPLEGRPEFYVEGEILAIDTSCSEMPYAYYLIIATAETDFKGQRKTEGGRIGQHIYVPMETGMDWDSRITKI